MRLRLVVVPTAERHIRSASSWWRVNRPAAPELFAQELARTFDVITVFPAAGPRLKEPGFEEVRRFHLARVHYHLYYRVSEDKVEVLACWHASRGSGPEL